MNTERDGRIVDLWHAGSNGPQIAREVGCGTTLVYRVLKRAGIDPAAANRQQERAGNRRNSPEAEREIVRLYQDGASMAALGEQFGCHLQTIANVLRRHGTPVRAAGGPERQATREEAEEILRRWRAGESQAAIGRTVGMSALQVSRLLRLHGLSYENRRAKGDRHGMWKGGRSVNGRTGYVFVLVDMDDPMAVMRNTTGYVMEHRLVIARALGRPLHPWETVHHIDGNPQNNDLANLQLRVGKHGKGVVMHCGDCGSANVVASDVPEQLQ